jgi:hypothetical protein
MELFPVYYTGHPRIGFNITKLGQLGMKLGLDAYYLYKSLQKLEQMGLVGDLIRSTNRQMASGWIAIPEHFLHAAKLETTYE